MVEKFPPRAPEPLADLRDSVTKILNRDVAAFFLNFGENRPVLSYARTEYPGLYEIRASFQLSVRFRNPKTRRVEPLTLKLASGVINMEVGDFSALEEKFFANLTFGEDNFNIRARLNLLNSKVVFYMFRNKLEEQITAARSATLEDLGEFQKVLNILRQPQTQPSVRKKSRA